MLKITAPSRIDLAGGTLDIFPLYVFEGGGITLNLAIDLETSVIIEKRDDGRIFIKSDDLGIETSYDSVSDIKPGGSLDLIAGAVRFFNPPCGLSITTKSSLPKGSGLAASSSLLVALCKGLCRICSLEPDPHKFIDWCANIEAEHLGIPTGKQDYYAAYFGGLSRISFGLDGISHEHIRLSKLDIRRIEECMILSFTGISHFSGTNNWNMTKRYIDDSEGTRDAMKKIKSTAIKMSEAIGNRDISGFADALDEEWRNRRNLAEGVSNEKIDKIMLAASEAGAMASKICGAGGGGCMVTVCMPEHRAAVIEAIKAAGAEVMDFRVRFEGAEVSEA